MNSSFGESGVGGGSGDADYGANAALTELEKGLRSAKVGDQAEAIVRFPALFSQFPFPILINSGMMKLAELFKQGSNFLKLCVLRVFQRSSLHLDKVTSVDEFVRKIITVINSNDPVARALTLRVLGAIAPIIAEKKTVHHKVRCSLDSNDEVELYAGIFAAKKFAATSKTFSTDMCSKLLELLHNPATSLPVKLKLLPILQHMYHSAETASLVRDALTSMLPLYPGQALLTLALRTLTSLAINTLVDIPAQVTLLLEHVRSESRLAVRLALLEDLSLLARSDTAHHWTSDNVESMIMFTRAEESEESQCLGIDIIRDIVSSVRSDESLVSDQSLLDLCSEVAYSDNVKVGARGLELLSVMAVNTSNTDTLDTAVAAIENYCFMVSSQGEVELVKKCIKCILMLCRHQSQLTDQFVEILGSMMVKCQQDSAMLHCVLSGLASLASRTPGSVSSLLPDITVMINQLISDSSSSNNLVLLLTLLLQTLRGCSWPHTASQAWTQATSKLEHWFRFRVARAASRYGHHGLAANIYSELAQFAESDSVYSWLEGLTLLSQAENTLIMTSTMGLQERLTSALTEFHRAVSSLRCASSSNNPLSFQLEFVNCRIAMVTVLLGIVSAASSLSTSPPPAIAVAHALQSKDELQKCGRVTPQIRKVIKQLEQCSSSWVQLSRSSFDADHQSLTLISLQQQTLSSLATWIEMVILKSTLQGDIYLDTDIEFVPDLSTVTRDQLTVELSGIISNIETVAAAFHALDNNPSPLAKPISHLHTSCLTEVVAKITSHPLPYPRFFFQSLQQTKIKLQVSPQPKTSGEPVAVNTSQFLAVKVEGVIQRSKHSDRSQVSGVVVQLHSSIQKGQGAKLESNSKNDASMLSNNLEQDVEPHNDFFVSQFLVPFPTPGLYTVSIDTLWRDQVGKTWRTGAKCSMTVKSFEDRNSNNRQSVTR